MRFVDGDWTLNKHLSEQLFVPPVPEGWFIPCLKWSGAADDANNQTKLYSWLLGRFDPLGPMVREEFKNAYDATVNPERGDPEEVLGNPGPRTMGQR